MRISFQKIFALKVIRTKLLCVQEGSSANQQVKVVSKFTAMDSSNTERYPSPPPPYFDQEATLKENTRMIYIMGKIAEYNRSDIESIQTQMETTKEAYACTQTEP